MSSIRFLKCIYPTSKLVLNQSRVKVSNFYAPKILFVQAIRPISISSRLLKSDDGANAENNKRELSQGEKKLVELLRARFPDAKTIEVNDISGGCGSMYEVFVEAHEFKTMRKVKQHQLINETLQKEIKNMHGVRIYTGIPGQE